jgi:hypothetical protein
MSIGVTGCVNHGKRHPKDIEKKIVDFPTSLTAEGGLNLLPRIGLVYN